MNSVRKQPVRTCIGCGETGDKKSMLRIVHGPDGSYRLDPGGKLSGRGAYVCPKAECLEKAFRTKALSRAFRENVSAEVAQELRKELEQLG